VGKTLFPTVSFVSFRTVRGVESRGTLTHLTPDQAVFEVYDPNVALQVSEVLENLSIFRGDRTIYAGRGLVRSFVPAGLVGIVSATLHNPPWLDSQEDGPDEAIQGEAHAFIREWERAHTLHPAYRLAVSSVTAFLRDLNRWLSQAELALGGNAGGIDDRRRDFAARVEASVGPKIQELFAVFEGAAAQVADDESGAHKALAQRETHPVLLCSPFVHRAYTKPLGYAGDYEMVNMILGDPLTGQSTYAKLVNSSYLSVSTATAHRNRIKILIDRMAAEARRMAVRGNGLLKVLDIGCGPAREVEDFILSDPVVERCSFKLVDFNPETIEYAQQRLSEAVCRAGRTPELEFACQSVHQLLRDASRRSDGGEPSYDVVYCAGLFDYLSDRVCSALLRLFCRLTKPGGIVLATNVHPSNPIRHMMDHVLEWYLIHRDESELLRLAPPEEQSRVFTDPTGVNVFLEIREGGRTE